MTQCPICLPKPVDLVEVKGNLLVCPVCDLTLVLVRTVKLVRKDEE